MIRKVIQGRRRRLAEQCRNLIGLSDEIINHSLKMSLPLLRISQCRSLTDQFIEFVEPCLHDIWGTS